MRNRMILTVILALAAMGMASSALATVWCGENGVVRLSFTEGKPLDAVREITVGEKGVTTIDLYAYLSDMDPLQKDGEAFLSLSALEMTLVIEGGEGFFTGQEFPMANRSLGRRPGEIIAGFYPGLPVTNEGTLLVHWQILFQGTPQNVVFKLDSKAGVTAERSPEIKEAGSFALYTGSESSQQLGDLFGAGYVPAYLNFEGEADLTPLKGKVSWQKAGVSEKR